MVDGGEAVVGVWLAALRFAHQAAHPSAMFSAASAHTNYNERFNEAADHVVRRAARSAIPFHNHLGFLGKLKKSVKKPTKRH